VNLDEADFDSKTETKQSVGARGMKRPRLYLPIKIAAVIDWLALRGDELTAIISS